MGGWVPVEKEKVGSVLTHHSRMHLGGLTPLSLLLPMTAFPSRPPSSSSAAGGRCGRAHVHMLCGGGVGKKGAGMGPIAKKDATFSFFDNVDNASLGLSTYTSLLSPSLGDTSVSGTFSWWGIHGQGILSSGVSFSGARFIFVTHRYLFRSFNSNSYNNADTSSNTFPATARRGITPAAPVSFLDFTPAFPTLLPYWAPVQEAEVQVVLNRD
ncbi:hypothetical protein GYMLUDRAFT_246155 [Collybiopsis luxurians FD-317 M1]|uniref:Uncharacterized protein n=1 Tax=Collybiopsis luxurians FD-317 M1 TaxID=944289 RepID=A0A0D0C7M8_9AGAR|nr:hypothetical protein GYMLUDRAFT_246155 [Collybiopsis luxurians FD-317 M1]